MISLHCTLYDRFINAKYYLFIITFYTNLYIHFKKKIPTKIVIFTKYLNYFYNLINIHAWCIIIYYYSTIINITNIKYCYCLQPGGSPGEQSF
jgi:hypothetical protein